LRSTDFEYEWATADGSVKRYCYRRFHGHPDWEDAYQETRLSAFRSFAQFRGESLFTTYAIGIASKVCSKILSNQSRKWIDIEGVVIGVPPAPVPGELGLDELLRFCSENSLLSRDEIEVLILGGDGFKWQDVERRLDIKHAAMVFMRAREKIKVVVCVHFPDIVGGLNHLCEAHQRACEGPLNPLTAQESALFTRYCLHRVEAAKPIFRAQDLRVACDKVCQHLPFFRDSKMGANEE